MKFKFKNQEYQSNAVNSIVKVFDGQPMTDIKDTIYKLQSGDNIGGIYDAFGNAPLKLTNEELLTNIKNIQNNNSIPLSTDLIKDKECKVCTLDIEMETGTGKTYVYIKSILELNKVYGWTKFIIVVPSIAIREGVKKSFEILEDHFMETYQKKIRYFDYKSDRLVDIHSFCTSNDINVMIINSQAFTKSLKNNSKSKESRIIHSACDDFNSMKPIEVIAANRPIIIKDEPQKMEGEATSNGIKYFNPLFILNFSATHKTKHNTVYALDPVDAYDQKLVKHITVKSIEQKGNLGLDGYIYLDNIIISQDKEPQAKIELDVKLKGSIGRVTRLLTRGDNLFNTSKELKEYQNNYVITEIDYTTNEVKFDNGLVLHIGDIVGDTSLEAIERVQIAETIKSHFEKERELFAKGIKTLSLFFIDKVCHYKEYGSNGEEIKGQFQKWFEEIYNEQLTQLLKDDSLSDAYRSYLKKNDSQHVHNGYFSIDKNNHFVDELSGDKKISSKMGGSGDDKAYNLILKNKERLLSFEEPTRFIFSHSALAEGWDNPNIFQICMLRYTKSEIKKRQEVGRGLRLCVNQDGERMDFEKLGSDVHKINNLTIITNESYTDFVEALQKETREDLRPRISTVTKELFEGIKVTLADGTSKTINCQEAQSICSYLWENNYINDNNIITDNYKQALKSGTFITPNARIKNLVPLVHELIKSTYHAQEVTTKMIENGNQSTLSYKRLDNSFKIFTPLWNLIKKKYSYRVYYRSEQLIHDVKNEINTKLSVTKQHCKIIEGNQLKADEFNLYRTKHKIVNIVYSTSIKYDLVGDIAKDAKVTRKTVVTILKGIENYKLNMFKDNPEEFIRKVVKIIKDVKAKLLEDSIRYEGPNGEYPDSIFTEEKSNFTLNKIVEAKKHIMNYVITDGITDKSVEKRFVESLDNADEVEVYAKLPKAYQIPTPVGNYTPDWAIVISKDDQKHAYFIAETKGSTDEDQLRTVERIKTKCAKKYYQKINDNIKYKVVNTFDEFVNSFIQDFSNEN